MESENSRRMDWPLARVIQVLPGKDNCIRLVKLKTAKGVAALSEAYNVYDNFGPPVRLLPSTSAGV